MVDWDFLLYMMASMGFGVKRRKRIHSHVSSAHFSILVYGSPKGYSKSSSGLWQGDPLSPMLFVIVAEALHALMEKSKHHILIKDFVVDNVDVEVTHLQFADDTIMFLDASLDQLDNLKCILRWFV